LQRARLVVSARCTIPAVWKVSGTIVGAAAVLSALALWLLGSDPVSKIGPRSIEPTQTQGQARSTPPYPSVRRSAAVPVYERAPALAGVVRSSTGRPLLGATICVLDAPGASADELRCQPTDHEGRFELSGRDLEGTALLATAPGHISGRQRLEPIRASGRPASVEITLHPGGAEIAGRVVDASGGPVAGAVVTLRPPGALAVTAVVMSEADGRFAAHVPDGTFDVIARAEAYSQAARRARSPARGVTLALAPAAAIVGKVVSGDTDQPVGSVSVRATSVHDTLDLSYRASTGADGTFRIEGLPGGGSFRVEAIGLAWRGDAVEWVSVDVGQTSDLVVLRVLAATPLTGHVTIGTEPCPEASVAATGPIRAAALANPDGVLQLDGLLPGRYEMSVRCPGALSHQEVIDVGAEPVTRRWELTRGLSVSGRVEGPGGEPVAEVTVNVSGTDALSEEPSASCTSSLNGEFSCAGLRPGEYDCFLSGMMRSERDVVHVALVRDAATGILLRAPPTGTIHARFASAPGDDSASLSVFARGASGHAVESMPSAGDGFVFERMPLGRYEVYVNLPPAHGQPVVALLQHHGQLVELELAPPLALSIQGRALDESGTPWLDAWVTMLPSDDLARTPTAVETPTLTDARGEFTLTGLAPGRYDLQVQGTSGMGVLQGVSAGSSNVVLRQSQSHGEPAPL
jgi:carboxypeptidase family protein